MDVFNSALGFTVAVAFAGIAAAAPTPPRNELGNAGVKPAPQIDRAALFRPATSGECGAVERRTVAVGAQRDQRPRREGLTRAQSLISARCAVVWTD
jgi:hypothetical protein